MNWQNVKLIFLREMRDQLRDRRTLFMILVLPILMYPALGLGLVWLTLRFGEEVRTIGLVGREFLPSTPALLNEEGNRFHVDLFRKPENQNYFEIDPNQKWTKQPLLDGEIDALVIIPDSMDQELAAGRQVQIQVFRNGTNDDSELAYRATLQLLKKWEKRLVEERMLASGKPQDFADPIQIEEEESDISPIASRSGTMWGRLLPFLLVMMALTAAFYPAIDLCAGEKERGTMETLLITPAARSEIVLGKFLTVFCFCVAITIMNLTSMGLTFGGISSTIPAESTRAAEELAPPPLVAIAWTLVLMLPLAAFFSALCIALAVFAKSMKEGQYYLMPLLLVVAPLVFLTLAPGVELTFFYSLVPVTNVALLLRALLLDQYATAMAFILPVLISMVLYGYLALRFANEQFHREEVLFREAERIEPGLWLRRLLREKEPTPSAGQAWCCFVLLLVLRWYGMIYLPHTFIAQAVNQMAFIGFPALLLSMLLTSRPQDTLLLRIPAPIPTLLAILLVFTFHPVDVRLLGEFGRFMPISKGIAESFESLLRGRSLPAKLLVLAILPAICEEIAFRGFILSGLLRKYRPALAILISSLLFGISHLVPLQMLNATLLGIFLGIIATRTGSIYPGMLFHALHNGLGIVLIEMESKEVTSEATGYSFTLVLIGALASALLIGALVSMRPRVGNLGNHETRI